MASSSERNTNLPTPPPIPENVSVHHHTVTHVMDTSTRSSSRHREGSTYFAMLGNITSDLNDLLTDLCPHPRGDNSSHLHPRDEARLKSGTIHSEDTLGKDSFLSSAGNTSRTRGNRIGSEPSLASSLDHTDHCDCDSVDSGHDGRCRPGPSPLVFDPNHFGRPAGNTSSPVTFRVDVSSSMEEGRTISLLERLIKTDSIWLLASLSRAGAVHLLKDRCTGTFIVRKSSQPNSLALSVQNRMSGQPTVDHYLIEGTDFGYRLQGSSHYFRTVPHLISFYMENREDIPYLLQLPPSIKDTRSLRELSSLALLGQEFWQSPISRRSPTPSIEPRSALHKSCSEPIDIQQPFHPSRPPSEASSRIMHNTLPSRSPTDFPHFMQTQAHMDRYFEQRIHHASSGFGLNASQDGISQTDPPSNSTVNIIRHTISASSCHTQTMTDHHPSAGPESTPPFPTIFTSTPQLHLHESHARFGSQSSVPQLYHHPPQSFQDIHRPPVFVSSSIPVSSHPVPQPNLSMHLTRLERTASNLNGPSFHNTSCQTPCAISAPNPEVSVPEEKQQPNRRRSLTHPKAEPKPKSSLYSTMNLGLLEIPENRYFMSSLADRLSDYEDVWKNNCDSEGPYVARKIQDPRSVLDSKSKSSRHNRHNPMFAKDGRRKVFKKTTRDIKMSREKEAHSPRDSVTGGRTGLTALERARLIAGSTSDEESAPLPVAHVKGIQRMDNIFNDSMFSRSEPQSLATTSSFMTATDTIPTSPSSTVAPTDESIVKETHINSIHFSNSTSPHQIKLVTSHSLDFPNKSGDIDSPSHSIPQNDSASKCVFTTTMSVIMSESASNEQKTVTKSPKPKPLPITNLTKIKSSSESSLATVSSPLYLEPADAVKLRDKNGKALNIHVRRRSAPLIQHQADKGQSTKVSQQTPLETIFSPNEANKQNGQKSIEPKFVFDNISPGKSNNSKTAVTRNISSKSTQENSHLQRKHSWKDRLNKLKLGTRVLTQNLTPPTVLNNRHHNMMAKQKPHLDNLILRHNAENDKDSVNSPAFSSPGPFPLDVNSSSHLGPTRASIFSDTSTVQDLISSTHPELAVKPIIPQPNYPLHGVKGKATSAMSEYDNLAGYRGSTHSSQGTIYCAPWETNSAHNIFRSNASEQQQQQLPPAMDLNERVQRWQIANSSYCHDQDDNVSPRKSSSNNQSKNDSPNHHHQGYREGKRRSKAPESPARILEDDLHITESHEVKSSSQTQSQPFKSTRVPSLSHQHSVESSLPHPQSPSHRSPSSPPPLSSHHPDVVNCHHAPDTPCIPVPGEGEEDILFGHDVAYASNDLKEKMRPVLPRQESGQFKGSRSSGSTIREYIFRLSGDNQTMFGSTIRNFIQCTVESQETNPIFVMRNVRQFMTGIKNYLVKHGEGQLEYMIERERAKLAADEILNIDAIIEQALHVCVLKPLKTHIYKLFVNYYSQNGALQKLSRNIKYARSRSAQELGVKPGLKLPDASDMEVISHHLKLMQKSYSPLQKLNSLLKATSSIYHCVQGKELLPSRGPMSLGADDFLPVLIYVIVHTGLVAAEIEADFMLGLLQQSLLTGEGAYYLTTLSSAVLVLKNFQDTHQTTTTGQLEVRLPAISDMQGFLQIAIPNETQASISWKILPVRPSMNTRDVCAMVAHKFKITNPQDYGLFLLCDGEEKQMTESECPQLIKADIQAQNKDCHFAFKRVEATIAWPPHMKHSPVTVMEDFE